MAKTREVATVDAEDTIRVPHHEEFALGSWVWVDMEPDEDAEPDENGEVDVERWFGCITHVGSNYIEVEEPHGERSWHEQRIHTDEIIDMVELEPDPEAVIREYADEAKEDVRKLLGKARAILARLGIQDRRLLQQPAETTALAVASKAADPKKHKRALVRAEKVTLPKLFEQVKEANSRLAKWAGARTLEMTAAVGADEMKVGEIKGRVRVVQLYAGLTEEVKLVREGEPTAADERLRIMQRRCYMDEESLLDYKHGGMEFKNLRGFDKWLSKRKNFERILPFPRCMVAFRVRRHVKDRDFDGTLASAFWVMNEAQADKFTYLYIRNGDRLSRLTTDIEFGPRLFPGKEELVIGEKMWGKQFCGIKELITDRELQEIIKERRKKSKAWRRANPKKEHWHDPYEYHDRDIRDEYAPYDPSSVYFDDMDKLMRDRIEDYNLIAYIVQGLFDRSDVLHPHPPARLWTPDGFEAVIELVHDDDNVLAPSAAPPSWEDYRAACNVSLGVGSVTIGQERAWLRREAKRENARRDRNWRDNGKHRPTEYRPYGNSGPGRIATVASWQLRARRAVFRWQRERSWSSKQSIERYGWRKASTHIDDQVRVGSDDLFNISAYKPGDYLQFFRDPRTRAKYLKWANDLLSAEEYHAGNPEFQPQAKEGGDE